MSDAFVPKHFPRTRLPSGRVLTDAQQYQYDVLRSVGGKLVSNRQGWWREHSPTHRERVSGLNATAMWSLVNFGLAVAAGPTVGEVVFATPEVAKEIAGPRYARAGQLVKEKTP